MPCRNRFDSVEEEVAGGPGRGWALLLVEIKLSEVWTCLLLLQFQNFVGVSLVFENADTMLTRFRFVCLFITTHLLACKVQEEADRAEEKGGESLHSSSSLSSQGLFLIGPHPCWLPVGSPMLCLRGISQ